MGGEGAYGEFGWDPTEGGEGGCDEMFWFVFIW